MTPGMERRALGASGIEVSRICLGTMTWGAQTSEAEAFRQLDMAVETGINVIDVGEMYPIPPTPASVGVTESILGRWLGQRGGRHRLVIAGKSVGQVKEKLPFHRNGDARLDRASITAYVDEALQRLGTDYLDLLQSHWPDRATNVFGKRYYEHHPETDGTPLLETWQVFDDLVRAGKVRAVGVSNETPWGLMTLIGMARAHGLTPPSSVQNPYSFLNRSVEASLLEVIERENCALMAYSPLAFGTLTGKYLGGALPAGARLTLYPQYARYSEEAAQAPIRAFCDVASRHGLTPVELAISFVLSKPFVICTIIGATTVPQLEHILSARHVTLVPDVLDDLNAISRRYPDSCV